jgi:hypothetical protein
MKGHQRNTKEVNDLIWKFIWDNKPNQIERNVCCYWCIDCIKIQNIHSYKYSVIQTSTNLHVHLTVPICNINKYKSVSQGVIECLACSKFMQLNLLECKKKHSITCRRHFKIMNINIRCNMNRYNKKATLVRTFIIKADTVI